MRSFHLIQQLKKPGFLVLSGNILNAAFGFISFLILIRWMGKDDFGHWLLYLAGFGFVEMLRTGFVYTALVKYVAANISEKEKEAYYTAGWLISIFITFVLSLLIVLINLSIPSWIEKINMSLFFNWYPVVVWLMLPVNLESWIAHANQKFRKMILPQIFSSGFFNLFLIVYAISNLYYGISDFSLFQIILWHSLIRLVLACKYAFGQRKIIRKSLVSINWEKTHEIIKFGKHSLFSTVGSNFLKSADLLIIGAMMPVKAVAIYQLPLKLMELAEIPLRSMATVSFPKISSKSSEKDYEGIKQLLKKELGLFFRLAIPAFILVWIFSKQIILVMAGESYLDSVHILRIFLVSLVLLPLDRFIGITLDSLNLPQVNSLKVSIMVVINVLGDIIAIWFFQSLELVAFVTIVNNLAGVVLGYYWLNKYLSTPSKMVIPVTLN